ncbi:trypsin-like peptidase domain-containing protein [Granulosicoccaceae sp. 1_MG-2023]|nr:trypsin-like peptidase domain-containing protein [Granulosicoccaceae sp. 1_MG-2023]
MKSANALFLLVMAAGGLLAGTAFHFLTRSPASATPVAGTATSFHQGVVNAAPAVVSLYTETFDQLDKRTGNTLYNNLFGENGQPPLSRVMTNQGSGVIISADGYILTNRHLIDGVDRISVVLTDGRHFPATLTGSDADTDLAVLKISSEQALPSIRLAADATPRVGDIVLAIGNPYGFGQTVTMGIVSATGRQNVTDMDLQDFIQIDAAINPGNSGGALINPAGELVGINTAIYSPDGGAQGIGFAVPLRLINYVVPQLIENMAVKRGWLGIQVDDLMYYPALSSQAGHGVVVTGVFEDSPAGKAGLRRGDIITRSDDQPVYTAHQLLLETSTHAPGSSLSVSGLRNGHAFSEQITLAARPTGNSR